MANTMERTTGRTKEHKPGRSLDSTRDRSLAHTGPRLRLVLSPVERWSARKCACANHAAHSIGRPQPTASRESILPTMLSTLCTAKLFHSAQRKASIRSSYRKGSTCIDRRSRPTRDQTRERDLCRLPERLCREGTRLSHRYDLHFAASR